PLTVMLLAPQATDQVWIDQSPIGGLRFFVIAGIVPALHIILELFDPGQPVANRPPGQSARNVAQRRVASDGSGLDALLPNAPQHVAKRLLTSFLLAVQF